MGRYTYKIAISNHHLKAIDKHSVTFSYKDYWKRAQKLEMTLEVMEFIRRFTMHVLPRVFVRIRHYGILSSSAKKETIPAIFDQLGLTIVKAEDPREIKAYNPQLCPCCQKLSMVSIQRLPKRGPPGKLPFHQLSYPN